MSRFDHTAIDDVIHGRLRLASSGRRGKSTGKQTGPRDVHELEGPFVRESDLRLLYRDGETGDWFEHDRIGFVSVPAEWSAAMLAHAALHTLDVNEELLRHGYLLKDATPANILFEGSRPVFVDVPSIEPLHAGQNLWSARHQFETTFLLPLLAVLDAGGREARQHGDRGREVPPLVGVDAQRQLAADSMPISQRPML